MNHRGFILQPTYRLADGIPVVHLWGVLESGGSFLIRDDRSRPRFWVRATDREAAVRLGAPLARQATDEVAYRTLAGESAVAIQTVRPPEVPPLRNRLAQDGIPTFEADVRFAYRYLIDRGIRGALEIHDEGRVGDGVGRVFDNPEVRPAQWHAPLSVLSIDIETDPKARRLLSIALVGCGADEVLLMTPEGWSCPPDAIPCRTERELLQRFERRVTELDPDVVTGWNVVDFDLEVLNRAAERVGASLNLGRGRQGALRLRASNSPRGRWDATIPGRVVLDGIQLVRGAFLRYDSYSLDFVSRAVLGEGKTMSGPDHVQEILDTFRHDRPRFVEYNRKDARLVLDILDKLRLVELAVERSLLTGMPPNRVAASIASFDFLYLSELGRRGIVAPSVEEATTSMSQSGGHVLESEVGLHDNVLVFDFRSLYPSVIRTFQIDPLGFVDPESSPASDVGELIEAPNGACFRREPGILPGILDDLFPRREEAKANGDGVTSQAIKILMNSFYGVLGTPACRFARSELANAITGFGREILLWSKARVEAAGHRVLYGDTDSLFVLSGAREPAEGMAIGHRLVEQLNVELEGWIREKWNVESRLTMEFERMYHRLFLPAVRQGNAGARKRYVGLVDEGKGPEVVFTGMEVVRRDWTDLAKQVQRELYERLFSGRELDAYLNDIVAEVRAGSLDDLLVYRKGLRKKLESYTASTPPHVAAARKMTGKPGPVIEYLMTTDGAEPVSELRAPLDREHYVQRQVRPVAEPVLEALGLVFDVVVGDDRQLGLF